MSKNPLSLICLFSPMWADPAGKPSPLEALSRSFSFPPDARLFSIEVVAVIAHTLCDNRFVADAEMVY